MQNKSFSILLSAVFLSLAIPALSQELILSPSQRENIEALVKKDSILELQKAMSEGALTAELLTTYFLGQIEKKDKEINAVLAINTLALTTARKLDIERKQSRVRGPLHGIPILIKDNIETKELPTSAGSLALEHNVTNRDAPVVARLRKAGVIILGKTNLSEWANFRSERSSSGWSGLGGQTRNPHDLNRSPCGSSSGSGAAVAAYLAVAALGTETAGSIICPSAVNGIVGVKPTIGLTSRTHIVPISHSQDTAGPMTRSVSDAAILLSAMQGYDPLDAVTKAIKDSPKKDYLAELNIDALKGKRIGLLGSAMGFHEGVDAVMMQAVALLKSRGAVIVDDLKLNSYEGFFEDSFEVLLYEFKHGLNTYLSSLPSALNKLTLASLIQFNQQHADRELKYFKQELFELAQAKGPLTEKRYKNALKRIQNEARNNGIDKLLTKHKLDVLIAPTTGPAWSIDIINGDPPGEGGLSSYPAVAGYPHITIPMGNIHGLPLGISFTTNRFSEDSLLAIAYAFEQSSNKVLDESNR